mmetsp:Transcript_71906/g.210658  ORF Transcript_71906/g.210658 Transcript_71906/m.210658 type:complete len:288 (+) Transcript_71906:445-1308(+)
MSVIVALRGVGEEGLSVCLLPFLDGGLVLHRLQLRGLVCDEGLKVAIPGGLCVRSRLEVGAEGVVHVAQDALHRPALRRVLLPLAHLRKLPQQGGVLRLQLHERGQGLNHSLHRVAGCCALLQERGWLCAIAENNDGFLQCSQNLLHLGALGHVGSVLLRPDGGGLGLRLPVGLHVLLELVDLRRQGGHLALALQHALAELPQFILGSGDGAGFARGRLLAPACVLVVSLALHLPVLLDLGLQVLQEVHHLLDRGARPLADALGAGREACGRQEDDGGAGLHWEGGA